MIKEEENNMDKEVKMAALVDDEGNEFELEVIKEFDYKDKKYAVLFEDNQEHVDECECDEECDEECTCGCHDEESEDHIYVFEVTKDENGKDTYNEISDSLMNELIPVIEKELYPTEK
jgi:uncharacterized protein YrzB (UPF0473 family)